MNRRQFLQLSLVSGLALVLNPFKLLLGTPESRFEARVKKGGLIEGENFIFNRTINIDAPNGIQINNCNFKIRTTKDCMIKVTDKTDLSKLNMNNCNLENTSNNYNVYGIKFDLKA